MTRLLRYVVVAGYALSMLLTGCATVTEKANAPAGQSLQKAQVAALKGWQLDGRFAYKNSADASGFSATIAWQNQRDATHIDVLGPLGLWRATFTDDHQQARLAISDGRQFQAATIDALMAQNLTWVLPVDSLKYWLFALPEPAHAATTTRAMDGSIASITQNGWLVRYPDYQVISGYRVPRSLLLSKGPLQIKLLIQRWQIQL